MIIKVFYPNIVTDELEHVADITTCLSDDQDGCEYAYLRTQNIEGSWSVGQYYDDDEVNYDYDPDIRVIMPLKEYNGRVYGHRSSMMGDVFEVNGVRYECRKIGFERIS